MFTLHFLPHRQCRFSRDRFSRCSNSALAHASVCSLTEGTGTAGREQDMSDFKGQCSHKGGQGWVVLGRCSHNCSQLPPSSVASSGQRKGHEQSFPGMADQPGRILQLHPQGSLQQFHHSITTTSPSALGSGEVTANTKKGLN